jgi:hypothetical protein
MFLQNVGICWQVCMVPKPRTSSSSLPWKPHILQFMTSPSTYIVSIELMLLGLW